jgi:mannose-6-phosphate isomerase-like protein (cupin superfamily)
MSKALVPDRHPETARRSSVPAGVRNINVGGKMVRQSRRRYLGMIVKLFKDHLVKESPTCGEIREILIGNEYPFLNIAVAPDIKPTIAHYHKEFDEIYFVLDRSMTLKFFDPATEKTWTQKLAANELCVIGKGIYHKVTEASDKNKLCVITVPRFDVSDEHRSDKI